MGNYNFSNLSPHDFEIFMRDLLNISEGLHLKAFAPGPDKGVDLRSAQEDYETGIYVVVQCKHYAGSTYANLRAKVKKEKQNLDGLDEKPDRYILATSRPLSSDNIDELFDILRPYCKSTDDIMGPSSIEEVLEAHPEVLKKHYKLWVTSTNVLERVLHAGIYNRSTAYLDDLIARSRVFVQPDAFPKAQKILHENHTCIISGQPGVGKTTLADMLCLDYLANGFELIVVSEDIREADDVYAERRKQVFIYDDFLGHTDLGEKLGKNEDNRIVEFIRRVGRSPNHRFILTTREHILRSVATHYERLASGNINPLKCVLEISNYNLVQKGLILYQHLVFSEGISHSDIEDLVLNGRYLEIVKHDNYTPRHITDALDDLKRRGNRGEG